jgi:hypothetical protein
VVGRMVMEYVFTNVLQFFIISITSLILRHLSPTLCNPVIDTVSK